MKTEKRKSSSTTITAEMEKRRRADLVAIPEKNLHLINRGGDGEGRSKTITDIPNDLLATILEYLLPYYNPIQRFVELTLVSKVWHRMVHAVSRIDISSIIVLIISKEMADLRIYFPSSIVHHRYWRNGNEV